MKPIIITLVFALLSFFTAHSQVFITEWNTLNTTNITVLTTGTGYNYNVYWEEIAMPTNNGTLNNVTANAVISSLKVGTDYRVEISGDFPRFYLNNNASEREKLRKITQWGGISWSSFEDSFYGAANLDVVAVDKPNLTNVTSLKQMFLSCATLNGSGANWQWDTENIININAVFAGAAAFNQNISSWNVSNVTNMAGLFSGASLFNQNISSWDVSNVTNMSGMFKDAIAFNQDINLWNTGKVTNMSSMFYGATLFNQPIGSWDVSKATNMQIMFRQARNFNQPLNLWNVGSVTNMSRMFESAINFNGDISTWDVSNVTNMAIMFKWASSFNQPLNSWNVGKVTSMSEMFAAATNFNQPLDAWDVSKATNMNSMFLGLNDFNQDISAWDVGSVTNMSFMFYEAETFNQPLNIWNVSNVVNMSSMFQNAFSFNQNLKDWEVSNVTNMINIFQGVKLSPCYYDDMLNSWSALTLQQNVTFNAGTTSYTDNGSAARQTIIDNFNWNITDQGFNTSPYVIAITNSTVEDVTCNGLANGSINIGAFGGIAPLDFEWSNTSGYTNSGTEIDNLEADVYTLTVTDAKGCFIEQTYTVTIPDELQVLVNVSGADISLSVSGGTANYSYDWAGPDNFTSNTDNITATVSGDYTITVTDENGCEATATESVVVVSAANNLALIGNIKMYPNPASIFVLVELEGNDFIELNIYDVAGKLHYSQSINTPLTKIETEKLSSGCYILQFSNRNNIIVNTERLNIVN